MKSKIHEFLFVKKYTSMSKKATTLFLLYLFVLSGCKKENDITNFTPPPANPYAANEALINTTADVYLIADVEGLTGVTHLNEQNNSHYVTANWAAGHCYTGACAYGGGLQSYNTSPFWLFKANFYGTGETRQNLLVEQYTQLMTSENHGVELVYQATNGNTYKSTLCNNALQSWTNITLVKREDATGSGATFYLTLKFNCELANQANTSQRIQFKNAVLRIKL